MRSNRPSLWAAACLAVFALVALPAVPVWADADDADTTTVLVLCEVWRATEPALVGELEALTERDPGAAEGIRARLRAAGGSAERLARLLTPATNGNAVTVDDMQRVPTRASTVASGGNVVGGFGGFVEVGANLELLALTLSDGRIEVNLQLKLSGTTPNLPGTDVPGTSVPPGQTSTRIAGSVEARSGVMRMFQSNTRAKDTVFVFVRATHAKDGAAAGGSKPAEADAPSTSGDFSDAEVERYRALKRLVDEQERRERREAMVARQLDRAGVELTDEVRKAVIEKALAFQATLRTRLTELRGEGGGREGMQAAMEALRAQFADDVGELVEAETAEKLVEALGRFGGPRRGVGGFQAR